MSFGYPKKNLEIDIKLNPVNSTQKQVSHYKLPRITIKDSNKRKISFEERYSTGAEELYAPEALYPGELADILKELIFQFRDEKLISKLLKTRVKAQDKLEEIWDKYIKPHQSELDYIRREVRQNNR